MGKKKREKRRKKTQNIYATSTRNRLFLRARAVCTYTLSEKSFIKRNKMGAATPEKKKNKAKDEEEEAPAARGGASIKSLKIEVAPSSADEKNEAGNDLGGPLVVCLRNAPRTLTDGTYEFNLFRGNPDTSDKELEEEFGKDAYEQAYNFSNGRVGNGDTPHSERHLVVVGRGDGCDVVGKNFAHEKCGFGMGAFPKDETQGVMAHESGGSMDVLGRLVPVGKKDSGEYLLKLQRLCGDSVVHLRSSGERGLGSEI